MTGIIAESKKFFMETEGSVAVLTIRTSEKINQFSVETLNEFADILKEIENNSSISVLILTGYGKAFIAGADIKGMLDLSQQEASEFSKLGQTIYNQVENLNLITIAAVNGVAVGGGCELSLACDFRVASEDAKFGQPEISIGTIPGWGGCYRLPRLVGLKAARDMIYAGKILSAQEARDINLVDKVINHENLIQEAKKMAGELLQKSPLILKYAKQAFLAGLNLPKDMAEAEEQKLFGLSFASEDRKEGMRAFIEKRAPKFGGR